MFFHRYLVVAAVLVLDSWATANPNCEARGHCIAVGPGTKYPEQNTVCLADEKSQEWHCAVSGGQWGAVDHTFGPNQAFDLTMLGGSPINPGPPRNLNETFTVHATKLTSYGACTVPPGTPAQWTVTRELTYLDGTADGQCRTRMFEGARVLGDFEHNCTVLTQMTIAADANGDARCVGCRCCDKCTGCACLDP